MKLKSYYNKHYRKLLEHFAIAEIFIILYRTGTELGRTAAEELVNVVKIKFLFVKYSEVETRV